MPCKCTKRRIEVEPIAFLDACVCRLSKVLGPPQLKQQGVVYRTGWAFCYPDGGPHWMLSHDSDEPVAHRAGCAQEEPICWTISCEVDDHELLHEFVRYVLEGEEFYDANATKKDL